MNNPSHRPTDLMSRRSHPEAGDARVVASVRRRDPAPSPGHLEPGEIQAWRVPTVPGRRYLVLTRVFSGGADTYVSPSPIIDPWTHMMVDVRSETGPAFPA